MINILYDPLPDSIFTAGGKHDIITDFRDWLRFADMLADKELSAYDKLSCMAYWLCNPPDIITSEIVNELLSFYSASNSDSSTEHKKGTSEENEKINKPPVFSWKIDAPYVLGDFRRFYNIDLLSTEYMHWWEFKSLFNALPDDSNCHKRIIYRGTNLSEIKNASERERIRRIQRQIALPFEYSDEDIGDIFGGTM